MTDTVAPPVTALAVTDSQASLVVIDRMVNNRQLYNTLTEFDIVPVDEATLRRALAGLLAVQPALRTQFAASPIVRAYLADVPEPADVPLDVVTSEDVEPTVDALGGHAFDLLGTPLYRFAYVRGGRRSTLVVLAHHLVIDGFSLRPISRDLSRLLTGALSAPEIEQLRVRREGQLVAELEAQNRSSQGATTADQAAAWADDLRGVTGQRLYPRPNAPIETAFTGERRVWHLDVDESADVGAACRRLGVSPFGFFMSVYGAVLARHTAASTVVIGSPFMSRRTVGGYELCGFFVNTLPIVFDVPMDKPFGDYVRDHVSPALEYARTRTNVAFNQIVAYLRPDRSSNRNPVFAAMLAMSDKVVRSADGPVRLYRERGNHTAKFDIWFGCTPVDDTWTLELENDLELVPEPVLVGFHRSLTRAIARAATAPAGATVSDLFDDDSLIESRRTDGYRLATHPASLVTWIAEAAAARPDAVAIDDPAGAVTYADLTGAVDRAARGLVARDVAAGNVVGLHGERLTDTIVAILAITRVGAAYLPLDADLPPARLAYMVERAGTRLIIGALAIPGVATVTYGDLDRGADVTLAPPGDAPGAVYVMFSSGSTGAPKGIAMGEPPLANLTAWQIAALEMTPQTRFLQYAPLGFDVSFQEIVPTLAVGGTVVSREPVDRRDFHALVERIAQTGVTHVYLPVAALRSVVQAAAERTPHLPALRYLCVSGEQLILDDQARAFIDANPHITLVNLYGPTETHAVTTARFGAGDPPWPAHAPIGSALTGVATYIVDRTGRLAPRGVPGELYLGGVCPARGYINDPDRTEASFRPDPYAGVGTMYRTGDQVMRDAGDDLIFLGRNDEQVKIRGYRVELGEIEAVSNAVAGVRRAVAATRDGTDGRELLLFAVLDGATTDDLRERLRDALPSYMVPARIFAVDRIPATINGKSDRAVLVADAQALIDDELRAASGADPVYRDDLERGLAEMWADLLGVGALGTDVSLLECGAHSLSVFAGLGNVERAYGASMSITEFFRTPTIAALAEAIRRDGGGV
jgi:amino acid adenylation domain-containing protein